VDKNDGKIRENKNKVAH